MAEFSFLVEGGKASTGPPISSTLGPLGVNIGQIVAEINKKTSKFQGMKVPVTVVVDTATKKFEIKVGTPPTSALIKRELSISKGASRPGDEVVGNLSLEQVKKIASEKLGDMRAPDIRSAVKQVLGTCVSMGVTVDGKDPREVQRLIDSGEISF